MQIFKRAPHKHAKKRLSNKSGKRGGQEEGLGA